MLSNIGQQLYAEGINDSSISKNKKQIPIITIQNRQDPYSGFGSGAR